MTLLVDWRKILRRAWSMRFMALAIVVTILEAVLPIYGDTIPRGIFSIATAIAIAGGMVSRVVAQKNLL